MSTHSLGPTSFLVLGLLTREGPSTPYELKRHAASALGQFWSFPHALLYAEPARLVKLGFATEERETHGRRRRTFTITRAGTAALCAWLELPTQDSMELRDPGLLQLFFADLGSSDARRIVAREQLSLHRTKLEGSEDGERLERKSGRSAVGNRMPKGWQGQSLRFSVLYERAAVQFWEGVVALDPAAA